MSGVGTGDAFVMGSTEFATPIPFVDRSKKLAFLDNVRLTAWVDAGQVFNTTIADRMYDRPGYAISSGVGMKLFIPGMGPLSIDYGIPLTHPGRSGNMQGYFTFGVGDIMY
jgi:outer membrane protein assembly factor BamA